MDLTDTQVPSYGLSETGERLAKQLQTQGFQCEFVVRAPGRVNLIGEHIDYNGYAVLPMALEQAVHLAVAKTSKPTLQLLSTQAEFKPEEVSLEDASTFGSDGPPKSVEWFQYLLCAYHGIAEHVKEKKLEWKPTGLAILVGGADYGGLWPAAGLSSSSALVVAAAVAIMRATQLQIGRRDLADLCARCERYIGMQGGGMDQAASLLGCENSAILIEFTKPLVTVRPVPLPSGVVFVIAHSGVHARKAATSRYNERVSECRLAAKLLCNNAAQPDHCATGKPPCLADAQRTWNCSRPGEMLIQNKEAGSIIDRHIPKGLSQRAELVEQNLLNDDEIQSCLTPTTKQMSQFRLYARAEHVYSEAERVLAFHDLCQTTNHSTTTTSPEGDASHDSLPDKLGDLMNQSQTSCARLYDCSCEALDQLIAICRSSGALGSRLTGAGWGGCTVSLVPEAQSNEFMKQVREKYYEKRGMHAEAEKLIFVSQAGAPAGIMMM